MNFTRIYTVDLQLMRQNLIDLAKLDSVDLEDVDFPPSIEELDAAVMQLGKNKTSGLDSLTSEFFQSFWPLFKDDFSLRYFSHLQLRFSATLFPSSCHHTHSQKGRPH